VTAAAGRCDHEYEIRHVVHTDKVLTGVNDWQAICECGWLSSGHPYGREAVASVIAHRRLALRLRGR
jgi:hypothetical protein